MRKKSGLLHSAACAVAAVVFAGMLLTSCGGGGGEAPATRPSQEIPANPGNGGTQKPEEKPASSKPASSISASSAVSEVASSSSASSASASEVASSSTAESESGASSITSSAASSDAGASSELPSSSTSSSSTVSSSSGEQESRIPWVYQINSDGKTATLMGVGFSNYYERLTGVVTLPRFCNGIRITAVADGAFCGQNIQELVIPEGIERLGERVFESNCELEKVTIQGKTDLGEGAFYNCYSLRTVNLNPNITEIPMETFWECSSLKTIELPAKLEKIGNDAFLASGLSEIVIPDTVKEIGKSAFCGTALKKVVLPKNLVEISDEAFNGCSYLTSVYIPKRVVAIGNSAFLTMQGGALNDIYYEGSESDWNKIKVSENGNEILKQAKIHYTVKTEEGKKIPVTSPKPVEETGWIFSGNAIVGYSDTAPALSGTVEFPAYYYSAGDYGHVYQVPITTIGTSHKTKPFKNCSQVTSFVIPEGVTKIEEGAFYQMEGLTSITFPSTLKTIGEYAFNKCKNIRQLQLPDGLETIGYSAFSYLRITELTVPESVKTIEGWAFFGNEYLKTVNLQCNATVGENVFCNCTRLEDVRLNDNMLEISKGMFSGCDGLKKIKLPKNLKVIGDDAFGCSGLEELELPETVTTIGEEAFEFTNLKKVALQQNVTKIGLKTFYYCNKLQKIYIPAKVTYIDMSAFENCSKLTDVYYAGTEEQWKKIRIEETGNKILTTLEQAGKIHYQATPTTMNLGL